MFAHAVSYAQQDNTGKQSPARSPPPMEKGCNGTTSPVSPAGERHTVCGPPPGTGAANVYFDNCIPIYALHLAPPIL